jgi:hypothetical protein
VLDVPAWPGHRAAHPDARITAHVLVSNRSATAAFYTTELETLTPRERLHVARTYTRQAPDDAEVWRAVNAREPTCRAGEDSIQGGAG